MIVPTIKIEIYGGENMEQIKLTCLEIENFKRIKAVQVEFTENGLTIIGGKNGQGKTSVLDAIVYALGGEKYRPSNAVHEGSSLPPRIHLELSNGLVVERKGNNGALRVFDPNGKKAGQALLNSLFDELVLNIPKFMEMKGRDKAKTLLNIIGIGDELAVLDKEEQTLTNQRLEVGRIAKKKRGAAEELPSYPDAPAEIVSASELIKQQQEILAKNGENQRKREQCEGYRKMVSNLGNEMVELQDKLETVKEKLKQAQDDYVTAQKSTAELQDESTAELEENIANVDAINVKVRANQDKQKAIAEADEVEGQYKDLSAEIESKRKAKLDLLAKADLPLPELTVKDGELMYKGQAWDCMSGSEQLKVATAIVRKLNPKCGFVLMDKLEQMDVETMQDFGAWLESEGLQVIATRVSTGDECSIIIEDGYALNSAPEPEKPQTKWGDEF
jgi:predicted ATP-dependent endonuclease of OLD family